MNNTHNLYLIMPIRKGDDIETPIPELPINIISTKLLFFLKYCPTITVALSRNMPSPMAKNKK